MKKTVLVLSTDPIAAALLGMLAEATGYSAVFAAPEERPEDAISRVRPIFVVLLDASMTAARSDLFFITAARRRFGLAILSRPGVRIDLAEWAMHRNVPCFEIPTESAQLTRIVQSASICGWWRASTDRRRLPRTERDATGKLVFVDRSGEHWHVYDRRGADRRQTEAALAPDSRLNESGAASRVFRDRHGSVWLCELREHDVDASPVELERQLARASLSASDDTLSTLGNDL